MLRNKLVRSDGSIIDSSVILSCEYTEEVNSGTNLTVGNITSSELTVNILNTSVIQQDEVLTYYIIEDGVEKKIGVFNAEKPVVATRSSLRFSAYDNIAKTEKIFSDWLRDNQDLFPMTLLRLVQYACEHAGVTLATTDFPQASLSVGAFYADDLTCRQILSWAGAVAGRFIRANANGGLEFAWYASTGGSVAPSQMQTDAALNITDDGEGNIVMESEHMTVYDDGEGNVVLNVVGLNVTNGEEGFALTGAAVSTIPYLQGSLSYEGYTTDMIERVQINHSEDDVGVIYPPDVDGNCFTISDNMILGVVSLADATQVATDLFAHLNTFTYVPFNVTVPKTIMVRAGDKISITDSKGNFFNSYVMKVSIGSGGTTLSATGDKSYGSNVAVASQKYDNLTGKILSISKTLNGFIVINEDLDGRVGSLELSTEEFKTFVQDTYVSADEFGQYKTTTSTQLQQTSENFEMKFNKATQDLDTLNDALREEVDERSSYIRFVDGNILLGKSNSDFTALISNEKISFMQSGTEVAYISNNSLYITQAEILTQIRIGKFGFIPGANGNLSFKKVVT